MLVVGVEGVLVLAGEELLGRGRSRVAKVAAMVLVLESGGEVFLVGGVVVVGDVKDAVADKGVNVVEVAHGGEGRGGEGGGWPATRLGWMDGMDGMDGWNGVEGMQTSRSSSSCKIGRAHV